MARTANEWMYDTFMSDLQLCEWEVQEFIEQVKCRPTLWFGKDRLWIRRQHGRNILAVKFVNGLVRDMSAMHVVALGDERQAEADKYALWLLSKFTSYVERTQVETLLRERNVVDAARLARDICRVVEHIAEAKAETYDYSSDATHTIADDVCAAGDRRTDNASHATHDDVDEQQGTNATHDTSSRAEAGQNAAGKELKLKRTLSPYLRNLLARAKL